MKNKFKVITPIFIGTMFEWYDFSIFVFLAPIMASVFFPASNKIISILFTYAVFAVGFIIRPLGALFFGQYADRYGRKKSMLLSMLIITITTMLMGLLPTYEKIGITSSIFMILLRLIQGFCIGGESSGSALYAIEMYPDKNRGLICSFMWSAVGFGMLLGSLITSIMFYNFSQEQLSTEIWRIPYIFSFFTGVAALYFRKNISETYLFQLNKNNSQTFKQRTHQVILDNKKTILNITLLYGLSSIITYIIFVFMPFYMNQTNGIDLKLSTFINTTALALVTFFVPISGAASDKFGRKTCLYIGAVGFLIFSIPLYYYMSIEKTIFSFIVSDVIFVLLAILYQGAITATIQESTYTQVRFTLTSFGYNISYGLFGGTAPLIVSWLSKETNVKIIPGAYLTLFSFLALFAIYKIKETYKVSIK